MDKWPEVFADIIGCIVNESVNKDIGNLINGDIKVENPQPYLYPDQVIPKPEVKS